ncbi:MAG: hypothetical protein EOO06_00265 [Chitinophagaceae bacterium]|nr:MAG: hypothetical protein EOO06_00265 [Chitinophagaceae bacterium]
MAAEVRNDVMILRTIDCVEYLYLQTAGTGSVTASIVLLQYTASNIEMLQDPDLAQLVEQLRTTGCVMGATGSTFSLFG